MSKYIIIGQQVKDIFVLKGNLNPQFDWSIHSDKSMILINIAMYKKHAIYKNAVIYNSPAKIIQNPAILKKSSIIHKSNNTLLYRN